MFPIRPVVVAVVAACGSLLLSTTLVMAGDKIKIENSLGFHTSKPSEFFRAFWESLNDRHKMKGKVSDHLTKGQIDTIFVLAVNISIAAGPKYPSLQDELLAFMTEGNRFETGRLPDGFEKASPAKYVVAMFRTKKGDYGLITRYSAFAVIERNGYVGVAPVAAGGKTKQAAPAKKESKRATDRPPGDRWDKLRAAYEQIAKLHAVNLSEWIHRGALDLFPPPLGENSNEPTAVLFRMGVDALPPLAEALDDETPTATVTLIREGSLRERKVWKVNELAAQLIVRIADRDFVIGPEDKELTIREIGQKPAAAPELKKAVIDWHAKFASKTPTERKIADVTDGWFRNRMDAVIWLGKHKAADSRAVIAARVDAVYADRKWTGDSTTRSEMSDSALALGQIGDKASLPQVRRVCQDMSHWMTWVRQVGYNTTAGLFHAYRALALLGEKDAAIKELNRLLAAHGAQWEPSIRKDYEKRLAEAMGW